MNGFSMAGLFFVAIPAIIVGPFVLIRGRKKIHLTWAAFLTSVALWGFGMFKIGASMNQETSLFWWRIAEIGVILIPVFFVHFVISFLNLKRGLLLTLFYFLTFIFLYFNIFTDYFIHNLYFAFNQFYYISSTPLYGLFIFLFVISIIYSIVELNKIYKKSNGIKRVQIKYLILAFFIGFSGGLTSYPPVYGITEIYPAWNATIFISALMVSYAIMRYRLMDIRIAIRKTVFYIITAGFAYGFFYFLIWFYPRFFGGFYNSKTYVSGIIVALLFVGLSALLNKWVKRITNKYLFFSLYSYQETIIKLADELNDSIDLDKIVNSIVNTIKKTMQLDRAGVLSINEGEGKIHYKIAKVIGFNETNGISLVQDSFLTRHLERTKKSLIREELSILAKESVKLKDKQSFETLEKNMEKIEASLCLPLISGSKLIGIIVLGSKLSGDAYSQEDLQLLEMLSKQASVALENARLYKQVQEFSQTLQQRVDEQTKEIRGQKEEIQKAYEIEKQARESLERMNDAKNQFIMATQHHLRTPLTSMAGYLDLLKGGTYGKIPKKMQNVVDKFTISTTNEIKIVNDLLDISQFQLGRKVVFPRDQVDIRKIIEEAIADLKLEAEKKGIALSIESPDNLPTIKADLQKLKVAIYNIIDNAVKYTKNGSVTINLKNEKDKILIAVKDTGAGIPKEYQKDMFNRLFERGEGAMKMFATGRGIGLWITYRIVDAHQGKIWAESAGEGKGSTFFIELPVNAIFDEEPNLKNLPPEFRVGSATK